MVHDHGTGLVGQVARDQAPKEGCGVEDRHEVEGPLRVDASVDGGSDDEGEDLKRVCRVSDSGKKTSPSFFTNVGARNTQVAERLTTHMPRSASIPAMRTSMYVVSLNEALMSSSGAFLAIGGSRDVLVRDAKAPKKEDHKGTRAHSPGEADVVDHLPDDHGEENTAHGGARSRDADGRGAPLVEPRHHT